MLALRTGATVCVDDRSIPLKSGEGLLVFPFQFHHYAEPQQTELSWLFVTFELADADALAALRFQPFRLKPELLTLAAELVAAYETERTADLSVLLLALLLEKLRRLRPEAPAAEAARGAWLLAFMEAATHDAFLEIDRRGVVRSFRSAAASGLPPSSRAHCPQ
jgi:hypothetical protein